MITTLTQPVECTNAIKTDAVSTPELRSDVERAPKNRDRGVDRRHAGHGMLNADRVANRWAVAFRHVLVKTLGRLPGTRLKSRLIRALLGVKMGHNVGLACGSYLDPYDPSMITFGDEVILGYEAKIFVHMFTLDRQRVRPVTIGNRVLIGAGAIIAPGVTIGDGATIAPYTVVNRDVPAGALAMGNPMQIKKRSAMSSQDNPVEPNRTGELE